MVKDSILTAAGAALGLFTLAFVDDNVLKKVDNINCVAAPLAATAVMIFSGGKKAADAKSIIGGYIVAGLISFVISNFKISPFGEYAAVALTVIAQNALEVEHAPAAIVAFATANDDTQILDVISPAAVGAAILIGVHHVYCIVREKAKLD